VLASSRNNFPATHVNPDNHQMRLTTEEVVTLIKQKRAVFVLMGGSIPRIIYSNQEEAVAGIEGTEEDCGNLFIYILDSPEDPYYYWDIFDQY
jgi:hypothetical protein